MSSLIVFTTPAVGGGQKLMDCELHEKEVCEWSNRKWLSAGESMKYEAELWVLVPEETTSMGRWSQSAGWANSSSSSTTSLPLVPLRRPSQPPPPPVSQIYSSHESDVSAASEPFKRADPMTQSTVRVRWTTSVFQVRESRKEKKQLWLISSFFPSRIFICFCWKKHHNPRTSSEQFHTEEFSLGALLVFVVENGARNESNYECSLFWKELAGWRSSVGDLERNTPWTEGTLCGWTPRSPVGDEGGLEQGKHREFPGPSNTSCEVNNKVSFIQSHSIVIVIVLIDALTYTLKILNRSWSQRLTTPLRQTQRTSQFWLRMCGVDSGSRREPKQSCRCGSETRQQ